MKVFDLRCWRWLAMIFVATVVVACSEDDYDYNPAPADKTIPDVRPGLEHQSVAVGCDDRH